MPIPPDLSEAFDQAVKQLIAWDGGGDEPSVNIGVRPTLISAIAGLAEMHKDTMPASLFWRMVGYANRPDRMSGASELSNDSSYATGAWCLLQWVQNIKEQSGKLHADRTGLRRGSEKSSGWNIAPCVSFTVAAATMAIAALISAASAERINGGPIQQNGKCWHGYGAASEAAWGFWGSCAEKAGRRQPSTTRESRVPPNAASEALKVVHALPKERPRPARRSGTKDAAIAERSQQSSSHLPAEHAEQISSPPLDQAARDALFLEYLRWKELQKSV
jgi:hypothetical protein